MLQMGSGCEQNGRWCCTNTRLRAAIETIFVDMNEPCNANMFQGTG